MDCFFLPAIAFPATQKEAEYSVEHYFRGFGFFFFHFYTNYVTKLEMLVTDLICGKINKSVPRFFSRIPHFPNIWLSLCLLFPVTPAAPQEMQCRDTQCWVCCSWKPTGEAVSCRELCDAFLTEMVRLGQVYLEAAAGAGSPTADWQDALGQ